VVLTEYISAAMRRAEYKLLEDGTFFGEIPDCQGVWSSADTLEACRDELRDVLEDWILLGVYLHHQIPVIDGIDLNLDLAVGEEVA
jgi:predicted RNase H-like HicB family nuclease